MLGLAGYGDRSTKAKSAPRYQRRWIDGSVMRHGLGGQSQSGASGRLQPPPPLSSLLLDALNRDLAEAGVFTANVRLKRVQFGVECLDRVHISEL